MSCVVTSVQHGSGIPAMLVFTGFFFSSSYEASSAGSEDIACVQTVKLLWANWGCCAWEGKCISIGKNKNTQGHIRFGSVLKWSFRGTRCSRSDVRSTAGQSRGKPRGGRLQEQEGRRSAFSDPHSPKFYTDTQ